MDNMQQDNVIKQLRRELLLTRIFCMVSSVLTLGLLIGGFLFFQEVKGVIAEVEPVVEQLAAVDIAAVNETMNNVNASLESVDWEQMSETLGELDAEALNEAVKNLDTEELSTALENMNDAVESMQKLSDSIKSIFGG